MRGQRNQSYCADTTKQKAGSSVLPAVSIVSTPQEDNFRKTQLAFIWQHENSHPGNGQYRPLLNIRRFVLRLGRGE
jgi:hypothetical protein